MAWLLLLAAGLFEVVWAFSLKQTDGFTRPIPVLITVAGMIASFVLLSLAMRTLPLGTAYSIWTGIGAVGAFLLGIVVLGESPSPGRVVAALMIVGGIVMMRLASE